MRTDKNYRIWMNKYSSSSFQHICKTFDDTTTKRMFGDIVGCDYSQCRTRIELCKDEKGSWLHNHFDDKAKLFTLQLYLSDSDVSTSLIIQLQAQRMDQVGSLKIQDQNCMVFQN